MGLVRDPLGSLLLRKARSSSSHPSDGLPDPQGGCRHVDVRDTKRSKGIDNGADDRRCSTDGSSLTRPFYPEWLVATRHFMGPETETRDVFGPWQGVIDQTAGHELTAVFLIDHLFQQRLTDPLNRAADDLAFQQQRVEDNARIVNDRMGDQGHGAGCRIDLHLAAIWQPLGKVAAGGA